MDGKTMKLKRGQYVRHSKFGWGTILECDRHITTVYFYRIGVTKRIEAPAVFQVVEDLAAFKRRGA